MKLPVSKSAENSGKLSVFSPQILPLPAGIVMMIAGLAGGFKSDYVTIYVSGANGFVLCGIGVILTFYSLWMYRESLGFEQKKNDKIVELENVANAEKEQIDLLKLRNAMSDNQDEILDILEAASQNYSFETLKSLVEEKMQENSQAPISDTELALRLDKLLLQGFIEKDVEDGNIMYGISAKYQPLVFKPDETVIIS